MKQEKLLYFDLETTGTNLHQHGVIQIAAIVEIQGVIMEEFCMDVAPFVADVIDPEAIKVSGADVGEIHKRTKPDDAYLDFMKMIVRPKYGPKTGYVNRYDKTDKFHLVGYNCLSFDAPFLRRWFEKCGDTWFGSYFWFPSLDVMALAADYVAPYRHKLTSFKLADVCRFFGIEVDETKLHDALYDVRLTRELYQTINHLKEVEGGA